MRTEVDDSNSSSTVVTCLLQRRSRRDNAEEEEFESSTVASRLLCCSELGADGRNLSPFIRSLIKDGYYNKPSLDYKKRLNVLSCGKHAKKLFLGFLLSASSFFLGFLAFEPPLLGLLGKGDCLSRLWGLTAMSCNIGIIAQIICFRFTVKGLK